MRNTDLKYLTAYTLPLTVVIGLLLKGPWAYLTPVYAFVLVPIIETLMPIDSDNLEDKEQEQKAVSKFFDWLLYLNLPIVFGLVGWYLWSISWAGYSTSELIGLTFSVGIALGSNGINVAHELGHRKTSWERTLGKILLIPSLYMHFYIEHNYGHHLHAATREDPASARYNQSVYSFWFTSISRQYLSAWRIQLDLLKRDGLGFISMKNDMLWYLIIQGLYLLAVFLMFGETALLIAVLIGVSSAILLETINYIEHYGLSRKKLPSGRYERVREVHSWNSNHVLGRVMLYELTRHSDHHYRAHKKYQLLEYHEVSPQMPYGYPTSMVLSLFPPLWYAIMNKRIPMEMRP
ncbi:alkane 1-monooxygenase [Aureitalea marina]|uniref:Alkane 1-monooxygenase n=1 Tax=Aureitalea marina TaxID=930804 RepID=A0A2S7KS59_9FLAO|nr:alkane 1-monooxygenase [Aureitalea marina]PQB05464.1 alkane 1-monooxygenase [Aureitalea marina]